MLPQYSDTLSNQHSHHANTFNTPVRSSHLHAHHASTLITAAHSSPQHTHHPSTHITPAHSSPQHTHHPSTLITPAHSITPAVGTIGPPCIYPKPVPHNHLPAIPGICIRSCCICVELLLFLHFLVCEWNPSLTYI